MKKIAFLALSLCLTMVSMSCSSKNDSSSESKNETTEEKSTDKDSENKSGGSTDVDPGDAYSTKINIRYVDMEKVLTEYLLAKDVNEAALKIYSRLDQAQRTKEAEIVKFNNQIQEKLRNNGYLTEQSYNQDMQKLQKMQEDAAKYLQKLQEDGQRELQEQQVMLQQAIRTFVVEYNKEYHYDAILMEASGLYFNPALDITYDIIAGLNRAYNENQSK